MFTLQDGPSVKNSTSAKEVLEGETEQSRNRCSSYSAFHALFIGYSESTGTAPATTSKLLQLKIQAPSLKGNLLGDPTEQPIYVYLPPGYEGSTKRYPTLYLLHGFTANSSVWINGAVSGMKLQTLMDDSIKNGKVREMIVVAANGSNAYKGSFYRIQRLPAIGKILSFAISSTMWTPITGLFHALKVVALQDTPWVATGQ